ncbi:MAG: zf-TFIIB domain-containing protein [Verrucomicrobiales bacterium]
MKCPSCKGNLREKTASGMTIDICYGGCGGIWFDRDELERIDARGAAALHTIWRDPNHPVNLSEPRPCPRCPSQVLDRRWFSELKTVQIDTCPSCCGIWLDEGEFSAVHKELDGAKVTSSYWQKAIQIASMVPPPTATLTDDFHPVTRLDAPSEPRATL